MVCKISKNAVDQQADQSRAGRQACERPDDRPNVGVVSLVSGDLSGIFHNQNATVSRGAPRNCGSSSGSSGCDLSCQKNKASHRPPTATIVVKSSQWIRSCS